MKYWLNGEISEDTSAIAINDRGFLLGDGLFETFHIDNGLAQDIEPHFTRLNNAMKVMGLECPYSDEKLLTAIKAVIQLNEIAFGSLRLTVTRGTGPRGLLPPKDCKTTVLITTAIGKIAPNNFPPISLAISNIRRNETSPASKLKSIGGYLDNILALKEAASQGFDDAIMLNTQGKVACSTSANIFVMIKDALYTPPIEDGILNGITRQNWIEEKEKSSLPVKIQSITVEDLKNADEIWLTNSLIGRRKVHQIESIFKKELP